MPHNPRYDAPGCLHHVRNRGIARRTVFETPADARHFLSLLTRARRKGWIEITAYSIMATHFHLLVRSVDGQLSASVRWVSPEGRARGGRHVRPGLAVPRLDALRATRGGTREDQQSGQQG